MKLSRRTLLSISIPMAVLLFFAMLYVSLYARKNALNQAHKLLREQTAHSVSELECELIAPMKMTSSLAYVFKDGFYDDFDATQKVFQNFSSEYPNISGFYGSKQDNTLYKGSDFFVPDGYIPTGRGWYKGAVQKKGKLYYSDVYIDAFTGGKVITFSQAVYKNNEIDGVVSFDYPLDAVHDILNRYRTDDSSKIFILSPDGNFFVHDTYTPDDNMLTVEGGAYKALGKDLISGKGDFITAKMDNKEYIFKATPVSLTGWYYVIGIPSKEVLSFSRALTRTLTIGIGIVFLLILLLQTLIVNGITRPIIHVSKALKNIASGEADLTKRLSVPASGEIKDIVDSFNAFMEKLNSIVKGLKKSGAQLNSVSDGMKTSVTSVSNSMNNIRSSIDSVQGQIEGQSKGFTETSSVVQEVASNITTLNGMIDSQGQSIQESASAIGNLVKGIEIIGSSMEQMASSFNELDNAAQKGMSKQERVNASITQVEAQSKMLQEANTAIASIASQTNLLAMNAAIEAAHAGESGKGFAVVADEIRKLSETSTKQSKTIGEQLKNIRESITEIVSASHESSEAFAGVSSRIQKTDGLVRSIRQSLEEQNTGSQSVISSLEKMGQNTENVRNASNQMEKGSIQVLEEMNRLHESVDAVQGSLNEMIKNAQEVTQISSLLDNNAELMDETITMLGSEINRFKAEE